MTFASRAWARLRAGRARGKSALWYYAMSERFRMLAREYERDGLDNLARLASRRADRLGEASRAYIVDERREPPVTVQLLTPGHTPGPRSWILADEMLAPESQER